MVKEKKEHRVTIVMGTTLKNDVDFFADQAQRAVSDFIRLVLAEWIEAQRHRMSEEEDEEEE